MSVPIRRPAGLRVVEADDSLRRELFGSGTVGHYRQRDTIVLSTTSSSRVSPGLAEKGKASVISRWAIAARYAPLGRSA